MLTDANKLDPQNQNFVLWLAQAQVAGGDINGAAFTINKLSTSNPEAVAQFMAELQKAAEQAQAAQAAKPVATSTKK